MSKKELLRVDPAVAEALSAGRAVVALETTLVSHGFPHPVGTEVALASEARVREAGATPATIGIVDRQICVGLSQRELERFGAEGASSRKVGPRDIAAAIVQRALGGTTVGGTVAIAHMCGIKFMATGGIGGVHRGFPHPPDVSADLPELARSPVLVVAAGIKSLLDVPATVEVLETIGVPVLGWRTNRLPLFFTAEGGPAVPVKVDSAREVAQIAATHWRLGRASGLLVARPPSESVEEIEGLIEQAVAAATGSGISGQAVTPFVLTFIHSRTGGRSAQVNKDLIVENAGLAAEIALAYQGL